MRVLFVSLEHSYGRPAWGKSYEYLNFYSTLSKMPGIEASFYATDPGLSQEYHQKTNANLLRKVEEFQPDLVFFCLFTYELDQSTVASITAKGSVQTINWFADDHWRFHTFSKKWAKHFSAVVTTDENCLPKYQALGVNAVLSQWAVNPEQYPCQDPGIDLQIGGAITFVGQKYGKRIDYFQRLKQENLPVKFFGSGWEAGAVSQDLLVQIFHSSAINLNFTESPYSGAKQWVKILAKLFFKNQYSKIQLDLAGLPNALLALPGYSKRQIKARIFEVLGAGGFLLSGPAEKLEKYYTPDQELCIFHNEDELVEKAHYYLENPSNRLEIARRGLARTLAEHTYRHRFQKLFNQVLVGH